MKKAIDLFTGKPILIDKIPEDVEYQMLKVFNDFMEGI